jgi:hypothetical protein
LGEQVHQHDVELLLEDSAETKVKQKPLSVSPPKKISFMESSTFLNFSLQLAGILSLATLFLKISECSKIFEL